MTTLDRLVPTATSGLLDRERTVARAGFNRWLVPPAALAIHLSIGMSYGLSVFWLPLTRALGVEKSVACPDMSLAAALVTKSCDWRVSDLLLVFTIAIVVLGLSAALFGGWLERAGPRKAGVAAAICWGGGFLIGAFAIYIHQLWLLWLGTGVIGGIGLGLGYISPVSTLVKWFPDRRGMATGMAIMGFGGGAMIGSPLANMLMNHFKGPAGPGVWQTFVVLGLIYMAAMLIGAFAYRVPPADWQPAGWQPKAARNTLVTTGNVDLKDAHKTASFWLIWAVLCLNVSAGIGVLAMASPILQEIFAGQLVGAPGVGFAALDGLQKAGGRDDRGRLRRAFVAVQHRRPVRVGVPVGLDRPQDDILHLLRPRHRPLRVGADVRAFGLEGFVRFGVLRHPLDVRRRLRDGAGVSRRHFRDALRRCHPRPAADGVVDGRHHRARCSSASSAMRRSRPASSGRASTTERSTYWPACSPSVSSAMRWCGRCRRNG